MCEPGGRRLLAPFARAVCSRRLLAPFARAVCSRRLLPPFARAVCSLALLDPQNGRLLALHSHLVHEQAHRHAVHVAAPRDPRVVQVGVRVDPDDAGVGAVAEHAREGA